MSDLMERLGREIMFFDGAFGTRLQALGAKAGECSENRNITTPELIYGIHREYLDAGADIILANTFGANRLKLDGKYSVREVVTAGINIAKKAVADSGRNAYVALDIGSLGRLLMPFGDLAFEDAYSAFAEMVKAGAEAGADLVAIETMTDIYETKAAILAVKENCKLPLTVTVSFDGASGRMLTGSSPAVAASVISSLGADAVGINCGMGPAQCIPLLAEMRKYTSLPLAISPNAGLPVFKDGRTVYELGAEDFAMQMEAAAELGAVLLGGCCGTTPDHISAITNKYRGYEVKNAPIDTVQCVTSRTTVIADAENADIEIGASLDPNSNEELAEALRQGDMDSVIDEAMNDEDDGAEMLDINAMLPDINEAEVLAEMITAVQSVCALPLRISVSSVEALEKALRAYNGRPMVKLKPKTEDERSQMLDLTKKYGAHVVL